VKPRFVLHGRKVARRFQQAVRVDPRHVLKGGELDIVEATPRATPMTPFGLVQPDHGLCEGIVVEITSALHDDSDPPSGRRSV
jgi:hypothetical protein